MTLPADRTRTAAGGAAEGRSWRTTHSLEAHRRHHPESPRQGRGAPPPRSSSALRETELAAFLDDHQPVAVGVAEREEERHGPVAAHQFLVDVDALPLQLLVVGAR